MLKALDRLAQRIADFIDPPYVANGGHKPQPIKLETAFRPEPQPELKPWVEPKPLMGASVPKHLDLMTSGLKTIGDNIANLERAILKLEEDFEKELARLKGELASTMSVKRAYTAAHAELDLARQDRDYDPDKPADGGANITMVHSDIRHGTPHEQLDMLISQSKPREVA